MATPVSTVQSASQTTSSWRGTTKPPEDVPTHDWQTETPPPRRVRSVPKFFAVVVLLVGLGFLAAFVVVALDTPAKTPLVWVDGFATDAVENRWGAEDFQRFAALDGQTASVVKLAVRNRAVDGGLVGLAEVIRQKKDQIAASERLVLFLNVPKGVNDADEPAFLLPDSDPLNAATWVSLPEILDQITASLRQELPDEAEAISTLLLIDGPDSRVNLMAGMPRNWFCTRAADWLGEHHQQDRYRQFTLLLGASGDQTATVSNQQSARAFAWAVASGLAGQADLDANDVVTCEELASWVKDEVDRSAYRLYHRRQIPQLVHAGQSHLSVIQSLALASRKQWQHSAKNIASPNGSVSLRDVDALWDRWLRQRDREIWVHQPGEWVHLTKQLLQLESLSRGGQNTRTPAMRLHEVLSLRLQQLEERPRVASDFEIGDFKMFNASIADRLGLWSDAQLQAVTQFRRSLQNLSTFEDLYTAFREFQQSPDFTPCDLARFIGLVVREAPNASRGQSELVRLFARLSCRLSIEQGPVDARNHHKLVPALSEAESLRRELLDDLLIGTPETLRHALSQQTDIEAILAKLDEQVRVQRKLLSGRDRLYAKLPTLLRVQDSLAEPEASRLATALADVLEALQEFDQELQDSQSISVEQVNYWLSQLTAYETELQAVVDRVYDRFLTAEVLASADRAAIEVLLSTGLLSSGVDSLNRSPLQQRKTLRDRLIVADEDVASTKTVDPSLPPSVLAPIPQTDLALVRLFDRITAETFSNHEFADAPSPTELRERLARFRARLHSVTGILPNNHAATAEHNVSEFLKVASRFRQLAEWLPKEETDQIAKALHDHAWAARCFQQAETSLDDFLAAHQIGQAPWFVLTSNALIAVGEVMLHPSLNDGVKYAGVNRLKQQRCAVLESGLPIRGIPIPTAVSGDPLRTDLTLPISASIRQRLPSGRIAIGVGLPGERRFLTAAAVSSHHGTQSPMTVEWINPAGVDVTHWHGVADFRGHHFADPLALKPVGGLTVKTHQSPIGPASVVVEGGDLEPQAIMFVLDCSASMTETIGREGLTGEVRKLDAAREALLQLLDSLQDRHNLHLGVMLYGHRVAAGANSAAGPQWQRRYVTQFPCSTDLRPFEDVETILPPGRFRTLERDMVAQRLRLLLPWGETPLHLSLTESVRQLSRLDGMRRRTIVVITDGRNYQFNPTAEKRRTVDEVISTANESDVAIHLVGVGLPIDQRTRARAEFEQIAQATGGSCDVDVDDADRLRMKLRGLFALSKFSLTNSDGERLEQMVGQPISIPAPRQQPEKWTLAWRDQSVGLTIRGQESLSFRQEDDLSPLQLARSAAVPVRVSAIIDESARATGLQCGWFAPKFENEQLTLSARISREDRTYLDWDRRFLVMATPLTQNGDAIGNPIVLWESFREPGTGNPTYTWTISNWPSAAKAVRVACWFPRDEIATKLSNVSELLESMLRGESISPEVSENLQWQLRVDNKTLTLIERFGRHRGSAERFVLHLASPSVIEEAAHRRDDQNQVAVHSWRTQNGDFSGLVIERLDVFQFKQHALRMANTLELPVQSQPPLIPLTKLPHPATDTQ